MLDPGEDLLAFAAADTPLRRASAREHAGPCPLCGGTDRFRVSLDRARWYCRHCTPRGGDLLEYLRRVRGLSFREAAAAAGRLVDAPLPRYVPPPAPTSREPSAAWRDAAARVVRRAAATLWDPDRGLPGRRYLRRRGLTEETARACGLGFIPETVDAHGLRAYGPAVVLPWWQPLAGFAGSLAANALVLQAGPRPGWPGMAMALALAGLGAASWTLSRYF